MFLNDRYQLPQTFYILAGETRGHINGGIRVNYTILISFHGVIETVQPSLVFICETILFPMLASACSCFGCGSYETKHHVQTEKTPPPSKKVTFHDFVLQHHCLVENTGKPFFHIRKADRPPPDYNEFLEMKKWRMKLLEEKLQASDNFSDASSPPTTVFASTPRPSVETPTGKPIFPKKEICSTILSPENALKRNFVDNTDNLNIKMNLEESCISFHAPRPSSYPNLSSALDEGYSTSSQNGWPLSCGNPSISSPPSESFDDAYDTSSKSGTITKKEQEELQDLLKTFEETSSGESDNDAQIGIDELTKTSQRSETKLMKRNATFTTSSLPKTPIIISELPDDRSSESRPIVDTKNLSVDLKNVVNELLSIGNQSASSSLKEQKSNLQGFGESYENLLENITIFAQTGKFEVLIDSSDFSVVSSINSDIESDDLLFETNDSGIDDSMPGVTKEGSSLPQLTNETAEQDRIKQTDEKEPKSKDGAPRKHRKHRPKDASLHRSESEPRKSSVSIEKDEEGRSESLPRRKKHRDKDEIATSDNLEHGSADSGANNISNGEPKKLRHREHDSSEHRKRSSRSRDRKSEANGETEDGKESSEHRKRRSRSRERKSEGANDSEKEGGEHRKRRSSRSRERKLEEDGDTEKDSSEHRRRHRSSDRKTEGANDSEKDGGEHRKRRSSRSRERKLEEDGDTEKDSSAHRRRHRSRDRKAEGANESEKEGGENRKRHSRSRERKLDETGEENESTEHRKRGSRSRERKSELNDERGKGHIEHHKRSGRSRERKSVAIDDSENIKVDSEHESHKLTSKPRGEKQSKPANEIEETENESGKITETKKERRSEPAPLSAISNGDTKSKSRRSEPVSRSESSSSSKRTKKKPVPAPTVVKAVVIDGPKEVIIKTQDGLTTPDGTVVQKNDSKVINSQSSEYVYETPDGRHRVYLRSKDELPSKNKKESSKVDHDMITDQNTSIVDYGKKVKKDRKSTEDPLSDKYGISSDIISLLREEEKFWQKQQELKEWRTQRQKDRDSGETRVDNNEIDDVDRRKKARSSKTELELEEDKLLREAKRLERLRIHQDQLLKTFQDNLLREELQTVSITDDNRPYQYAKPPSGPRKSLPPHYPGNVQAVVHDLNNTDIGHSLVHQDPRILEQNYKYEQRTNRDRVRHREDVEPTNYDNKKRNSIHRNSSHVGNHDLKEPNSRAVCFSDDDEVFHEARRKTEPRKEKPDYRGYFSDPDVLRDNSVSRTYLARPLLRQTRTSLRCTACCKPISDERLMFVEGQNYYWHLKCFFCIVCNAFLNDRHTIRVRITNYRLHCRFCYSARNGEQLSEV